LISAGPEGAESGQPNRALLRFNREVLGKGLLRNAYRVFP